MIEVTYDALKKRVAALEKALATARKDALEEAAKRLEELHKNHNYNPESGTLTKKLGRYDRWHESEKTAILEHDAGYYRAVAEGVAHILALAKEEVK
jgi:predicted ArsR family transcriptional regulator